MMKAKQQFDRYEREQKVGDAWDVAPKANIQNHRMGFPTKGVVPLDIDKEYQTSSIETSQALIDDRYDKAVQRAKMSNESGIEFIDTNLGSSANKGSIAEINSVVERCKAAIESGSFFPVVVNDMYQLLRLVEQNIFKFDVNYLRDFRIKLDDIFLYIRDPDYRITVLGKDKQVLNMTQLVSRIYKSIRQLIKVMEQHQGKSAAEKKLIIQAEIEKRAYVGINKSYRDKLEEELKELEAEEKEAVYEKDRKKEKKTQEHMAVLLKILAALEKEGPPLPPSGAATPPIVTEGTAFHPSIDAAFDGIATEATGAPITSEPTVTIKEEVTETPSKRLEFKDTATPSSERVFFEIGGGVINTVIYNFAELDVSKFHIKETNVTLPRELEDVELLSEGAIKHFLTGAKVTYRTKDGPGRLRQLLIDTILSYREADAFLNLQRIGMTALADKDFPRAAAELEYYKNTFGIDLGFDKIHSILIDGKQIYALKVKSLEDGRIFFVPFSGVKKLSYHEKLAIIKQMFPDVDFPTGEEDTSYDVLSQLSRKIMYENRNYEFLSVDASAPNPFVQLEKVAEEAYPAHAAEEKADEEEEKEYAGDKSYLAQIYHKVEDELKADLPMNDNEQNNVYAVGVLHDINSLNIPFYGTNDIPHRRLKAPWIRAHMLSMLSLVQRAQIGQITFLPEDVDIALSSGGSIAFSTIIRYSNKGRSGRNPDENAKIREAYKILTGITPSDRHQFTRMIAPMKEALTQLINNTPYNEIKLYK
ncbi:MAG: hypothetical protein P4L31_04950 [Candidatus Babeliales bacterium]|nr:hypothetical protein [Candidatus Babeliales bacterium]